MRAHSITTPSQNATNSETRSVSVHDVDSYLAQLEQRVLTHPVLRHPIVVAFEREELTFEQVKRFGLLYYPHILRTRLYQAAALSISLDEKVQMALASILTDEFACESGRAEPERTHPAIYRKFLRALGWTEKDWDDAPIIDALASYIETHMQLCTGSWLVALGTSGFAMEWPIPPLYSSLVQGMRQFPQLDDDALELFLGHIEIDVEHSALVRDAVRGHLGRENARAQLERGIFESLDARYRLMTGLQREIGMQ